MRDANFHESTMNPGLQIRQLNDMENGTANEAVSDSVRIEVYTNINCIPFDDGHVAVGDIMMRAVAQMNAERFKRVRGD
jgi:hypothetical protein